MTSHFSAQALYRVDGEKRAHRYIVFSLTWPVTSMWKRGTTDSSRNERQQPKMPCHRQLGGRAAKDQRWQRKKCITVW